MTEEPKHWMSRILRRLERVNEFTRNYPLPIYILIFVVMAFAFWRVDENAAQVAQSRVEARANFNSALGTIVAVQLQNCTADKVFRKQYKVRGKIEKKLLTLFLFLSEQNVAARNADADTSAGFIDEFEPLTRKIQIIPLPKCNQIGDQLRDQLGLVGATLPKLDVPTYPRGGHGGP